MKPNKYFILTTLLIFPLPQMAIDLYLPSLPHMAKYFSAPNYLLQLTLTVYILALGLSQLIYGPCSDRFGRKPTLLIGTSIFCLGNLAAIFATSITQLITFRIIQGIGMGAGFSVASAIIGDTFEGPVLARITTFSSMIYSLSPLLAPVLGGYLQKYFGWRSNFVFIALNSMLLIMAIIFFIYETNTKKDATALNPKKFIINYMTTFKSAKFIGNILCMTLTFGAMITFNIVGPFLLQDILQVKVVTFGKLLFLVGLAYLAGTSINSHILKIWRIQAIIIGGIALMLVSAFALLIAAYCSWFTPTSVILFTSLEIFATGFVFPNCFAEALKVFPENLGTASAVGGSAGLIGTSLISVIVSHVPTQNEESLAFIFIVLTMLCILSYWLALGIKKGHAERAPTI